MLRCCALTTCNQPHHSCLYWQCHFDRPFYWPGIWAVVAISIWLAQLSGVIRGAAGLSGTLWHVHEMLFGFGALVAVGFLLTAAQNWTQVPALNGRWLLGWSLLWLSARVLAFTDPLASTGHSLLLLMLVQSSWWLLSIGALCPPALAGAQPP